MKKVTSILMAFVLMLTLIPTAWAEGESVKEWTAADSLPEYGTYKLMNDVTLTNTHVVKGELNLDLNGKTVKNESDLWDTRRGDWSLISVRDSGSLTITGSGTLHAKENDCYAIDVQDVGATVTIQGRTYDGNIHSVYVYEGKANIQGGTYSVQQKYSPTQPDQFVLNLYDASRKAGTATIVVTGGTFLKFNPADCEAEGKGTNFVHADYKSVKGDDDTYTVVPKDYVAQIGDTKYESLADAVAVGGDIKLLKDTAEDITILAGKTITIDLNGKKITNKSADTITVEKGAALTINGTGIVDNVNHGKAAIYNKGAVTLNGGTFERSAEAGQDSKNNGGNSYYTILNHGEMTVGEGVTVNNKGHHSSLFSNGYYSYKTKDGVEKPTLTINGGMFDGGLNTIKNDDDGILTINNGTFKNYTQAAFQNHGTATVLNGSFIAESVYSIDNCGCDATHDPGKLTVSGGTFKGTLYVHSEYSDVAITGGSFTGSIVKTGGKLSITGGTFNTNPKDYVPAADYTVAKKDGAYTVAKKDPDKDGTGENTSAVKLEVPATSGDTVIDTTVNKNDIDTNKELTVTNGKTAVTINQAGVAAISTGANLNLSIKADSKTPESANTAAYNKAMAGKDANSAVVVNISLTNGASNVFTTNVTGAYALVTVPYSTDKADKLTVYYLNGSDATALTKVVDAADSSAALNTFSYDATNKLITLKLPHFSEYLISTTATRSVVHHYGGSGTTTTTGTKTNSPTTFDAGVGIYAVSAILSVTGMAWVGTKQRKH